MWCLLFLTRENAVVLNILMTLDGIFILFGGGGRSIGLL